MAHESENGLADISFLLNSQKVQSNKKNFVECALYITDRNPNVLTNVCNVNKTVIAFTAPGSKHRLSEIVLKLK